MATIKKNLFIQGASGMLGNQLVYRNVDGKIIISTKPTRNGETSEAQKRQNMRFKYASIYAKTAIADETLGPIYSDVASRLSKFSSAYQLALTDYLKSPEIGDIWIESGAKDAKILVEAFEDPQLAKVEVAILAEDDSVVQKGEATLTSNGIQWEFILPIDIPEGGKIEVRAYDLPGNESIKFFDVEPTANTNEVDI